MAKPNLLAKARKMMQGGGAAALALTSLSSAVDAAVITFNEPGSFTSTSNNPASTQIGGPLALTTPNGANSVTIGGTGGRTAVQPGVGEFDTASLTFSHTGFITALAGETLTLDLDFDLNASANSGGDVDLAYTLDLDIAGLTPFDTSSSQNFPSGSPSTASFVDSFAVASLSGDLVNAAFTLTLVANLNEPGAPPFDLFNLDTGNGGVTLSGSPVAAVPLPPVVVLLVTGLALLGAMGGAGAPLRREEV